MKSIFIRFTIFIIVVMMMMPLFTEEKVSRWRVGEELTYKVKWAFVRLGTLRFRINDTTVMNDERVYHVQFFLDSNPLLFFVNHHAVYETYFTDELKVYLFKCDEEIDGVAYETTYRFDYADSLVYVDMTDENDPSNKITRVNSFRGLLLDGISLLYYAGVNSHCVKTDTVQYMDSGETELAIIDFQGPQGFVKIKALKEPVESCYLEGCIMGEGIAGLKGDFQGWFARDSQSPPLKAKLKVFIGSVILELESWENWEPGGGNDRNSSK